MWVVDDVVDAGIRALFQKERKTDRLAIAINLVVVVLALLAVLGFICYCACCCCCSQFESGGVYGWLSSGQCQFWQNRAAADKAEGGQAALSICTAGGKYDTEIR